MPASGTPIASHMVTSDVTEGLVASRSTRERKPFVSPDRSATTAKVS